MLNLFNLFKGGDGEKKNLLIGVICEVLSKRFKLSNNLCFSKPRTVPLIDRSYVQYAIARIFSLLIKLIFEVEFYIPIYNDIYKIGIRARVPKNVKMCVLNLYTTSERSVHTRKECKGKSHITGLFTKIRCSVHCHLKLKPAYACLIRSTSVLFYSIL